MIAAAGRFDMGDLTRALVRMAANANLPHDHEFRSAGTQFIHDCGWGAAYLEAGRLTAVRSASCVIDDPEAGALGAISTNMALLHARRTPDRGTIAVPNSHPFLAEDHGTVWAFCHNGTVNDTSQLSWDPLMVAGGSTDSELLFLHVLTRIDAAQRESSLTEIMASLHDYTCLNCFIAASDSVTVYAGAAPGTPRPRYYTLWRGSGPDLELASSEPVPWPGVAWEAVADGSSFTLCPAAVGDGPTAPMRRRSAGS